MLQGCVVEIEGRKKSRFWVFSLVDPSGLNLLRMSSESEKEVETWVQASHFLTKLFNALLLPRPYSSYETLQSNEQ